MPSILLGRLDVSDAVDADLATIRECPTIGEEYDEYSSGLWRHASLWNESGDATDTLYRDFAGALKETELARACPSVKELLERHFSFEHLRMVRTRDLVSAVVLPHVDFAEVDSGDRRCLRVLVPLETNPAAFHSDPTGVFHMRRGEVWYLDAALVHSAANFSSESRLVVCLDYVFPGPFQMQDVFRTDNGQVARPEPLMVSRKATGPQFEEALLALSEVMNRRTFKDIAFMLAKLHFSLDVPVGAFHQWIVAIAERTEDPAIADRARHVRGFLLGDRDFGERFSWEWEIESAVA